MLTPDYLKGCPQPFVELYGELVDFILDDISRRIAKAGAITDTAQWQMIRLKELGLSTKEIRQKITEINRMTLREINAAFQDAARESLEFQERIYSKAGRKAVPLAENEALQQLLDAAKRQTAGQMQNLTRSLGFLEFVNGKATLRPLAQVYQHTLDLTQMAVSSGAMDTKTAVRTAVKRLMDSGVRTVDYASGHVNHVDVAARRAIVTGVNQMSANMTDRLAEELGAEFFEVTAHAGARPSHQVWQGQVFHRGGTKDGYPDLESATGLGTVGGLCGANCRHSYFPFFPGASVRAYTPEKLKNIDPPPVTIEGKTYTFYEATQKQRSMETAMRKTKREMLGYEAAGLNEDFTSAAILLRRQQEAYNDFCRAASLRRQTDRAQVVGFSHSQSSKASWAARKAKEQSRPGMNDVLSEYLKKAKPGTGKLTYDQGYHAERHVEEVKIAQWLHKNLGGDIVLLNESTVEGEKRADYLWNGKLWDLKCASTEKSANSSVRHGLQQIRENPGGIVLNFGTVDFDLKTLWGVVDRRMQWNHLDADIDIMVIAKDKLVDMKRYKKKRGTPHQK